MTHRRLKKSVIITIYLIALALVISCIMLIQTAVYKQSDNTSYVNKTIFDEVIPVVNEQQPVVEQIINPYTDSTVKITRKFYEPSMDENEQKEALIYYENTYIPSTGITYKAEQQFEVSTILSGTVTSVKQDPLLGNVVEITHDNNIVSSYQSLEEVLVNENDSVMQGQVIGKSGNSKIDEASSNHLYFELTINNQNVNPLNYFGKMINEI